MNYSTLKNWYAVSIGKLPIHQVGIICQGFNIGWDAQLHRRYSKWVIFVLVTLSIIVFLISLIGGLTPIRLG